MGHPDWQNIHRADHTGLSLFAYMAPSSILYLKSPEQVTATVASCHTLKFLECLRSWECLSMGSGASVQTSDNLSRAPEGKFDLQSSSVSVTVEGCG